MADVLPRLIDAELRACADAHPVTLVAGPRACGKTTAAQRIAAAAVRLDRPDEAKAFRADPAAALRAIAARPLLLDEWQEVPAVMPALKAVADAGDPAAGPVLLTGSVRPAASEAWPATGRMVELAMGPMTQRELRGGGGGRGAVAALIAGEPLRAYAAERCDLVDYLGLALAGGFPVPALTLDERGRQRWYAAYVDQIAGRDLVAILRRADPARARRYLEACALHSGCVVDAKVLFDAAGINRKTADGYEAVLTRLFVLAQVPAWSGNRLTRLVRAPKRLVADAGLMAAAARITADDALRDGVLLGRVMETFVHAQLAPELAARHPGVRLCHLRTDSGGRHEVDFVLDLGGGRVIAIEVKSGAGADGDDARHLVWLRDRLGDDFVRGVVLHTGDRVHPLGDRIDAAPIRALWET